VYEGEEKIPILEGGDMVICWEGWTKPVRKMKGKTSGKCLNLNKIHTAMQEPNKSGATKWAEGSKEKKVPY
jgi:hypothetical protein